ncbi:hypothetical protein PILCRDRAFT_17315 [Piloderma croceum F 1598]|uniref:Uncharacterized protein n=1 Tax=Piloderma croceum (strain F 1598) TaxID=765440 RepID=A0A0C3ESU9_PILCF|nr:hypothetical protein PILCRDRAFT_17315 [Piloderma croceum F 1598]
MASIELTRGSSSVFSAIIYDCDFHYNYFEFERSYLLRINSHVAEHPQQMIMHIVVGIHGSDIECMLETYNLISKHAPPHTIHYHSKNSIIHLAASIRELTTFCPCSHAQKGNR